MDEPSKYTVAVYELINQQGDKTAEHISDLTAVYTQVGWMQFLHLYLNHLLLH